MQVICNPTNSSILKTSDRTLIISHHSIIQLYCKKINLDMTKRCRKNIFTSSNKAIWLGPNTTCWMLTLFNWWKACGLVNPCLLSLSLTSRNLQHTNIIKPSSKLTDKWNLYAQQALKLMLYIEFKPVYAVKWTDVGNVSCDRSTTYSWKQAQKLKTNNSVPAYQLILRTRYRMYNKVKCIHGWYRCVLTI